MLSYTCSFCLTDSHTEAKKKKKKEVRIWFCHMFNMNYVIDLTKIEWCNRNMVPNRRHLESKFFLLAVTPYLECNIKFYFEMVTKTLGRLTDCILFHDTNKEWVIINYLKLRVTKNFIYKREHEWIFFPSFKPKHEIL